MKKFIAIAFCLAMLPSSAYAKNDSPFDKNTILELVGVATLITRASKLCPQYEFSTVAVFDSTISRAKELIGDRAVDKKIDSTNTLIRSALANGLKSTFCDMAKNSDAEMESSSQ